MSGPIVPPADSIASAIAELLRDHQLRVEEIPDAVREIVHQGLAEAGFKPDTAYEEVKLTKEAHGGFTREGRIIYHDGKPAALCTEEHIAEELLNAINVWYELVSIVGCTSCSGFAELDQVRYYKSKLEDTQARLTCTGNPCRCGAHAQ